MNEHPLPAPASSEGDLPFRILFDTAAEFIFVLDQDSRIVRTNRYVSEQSGYAPGEMEGKEVTDFFTPTSQTLYRSLLPLLQRGGHARAEIELVCKSGHVLEVECQATAVAPQAGQSASVLLIQRDISALKRAEEKARHHQQESAHLMRLSVMGEMAASMAHELNQPLTALISYCGMALSQLKGIASAPDSLVDILECAYEQAHRASDIIHQIRNSVSKGNIRKQPVDIDNTVREVAKLLDWELAASQVELQLDLQGGASRVMANSVQIEQVLLNLIRNSLEAIGQTQVAQGRLQLQTRVAEDGRSLVISVSDNGPGISGEIANRLFEPFQTSKETGMGMGLSISRSILQAHQGTIWLDQPGPGGTTFCIRLPCLETA